jgi:hypothetical protein
MDKNVGIICLSDIFVLARRRPSLLLTRNRRFFDHLRVRFWRDACIDWPSESEVLNMMLLIAMLVAAGVSGGIAATLLMLSVGLSPRALR